MKAVMLEVPEALLQERRRLGHDRFDEMWEGVLHMVPPPAMWHQGFGTQLIAVLKPLAEARGLRAFYEIGFFRRSDDYRQPDHAYARPEQVTERGIEGPVPLVIEIRSPRDETDEKVPWYLAQGVAEVLTIDPFTRVFEVHRADGVQRGRVELASVGVTLETVETADGPRLRLTWEGGSADV